MKYLILFLSLILISCDDEVLSAEELLMEMEEISSDIQSITNNDCEDKASCKAKAIGIKQCGGPTHYVIYSNVSSESELDYLINRYNALNYKYNKVSGLYSDCSIAYPPTLDCSSSKCEIVQ